MKVSIVLAKVVLMSLKPNLQNVVDRGFGYTIQILGMGGTLDMFIVYFIFF